MPKYDSKTWVFSHLTTMIPRHYFNAVTGSTTDADRCVFTNTQAASEDLWRRAPTVESPVLVSLIWLEGCTSQRLLSFTVNTSQVETQNARDAFILKLFHETFGRHGWVSDNLIKTGRKNRQWLVLVGYEKHCRLLEMSSELKNQAMGRKKKKWHTVFSELIHGCYFVFRPLRKQWDLQCH